MGIHRRKGWSKAAKSFGKQEMWRHQGRARLRYSRLLHGRVDGRRLLLGLQPRVVLLHLWNLLRSRWKVHTARELSPGKQLASHLPNTDIIIRRLAEKQRPEQLI